MSHFIPLDSKKPIQQIGLEYRLFSKIIIIKKIIVGETYTDSKRKGKQNNQYLNFKVSRHDQKSALFFNTTGLKMISRQEKTIFTTLRSNNTFLVKKQRK